MTTVLEIPREVDRGNPTTTDLPLDGVAVGEGGIEAVQLVSHEKRPPLCYRIRWGSDL